MKLKLSKPNHPSITAKEVIVSPVAGNSTLVLGFLLLVISEVVAAGNLLGNGVGLTVVVCLELVTVDDPGFLPGLIVSLAASLSPSVVAAITINFTVSV